MPDGQREILLDTRPNRVYQPPHRKVCSLDLVRPGLKSEWFGTFGGLARAGSVSSLEPRPDVLAHAYHLGWEHSSGDSLEERR